MKIETLKEIVWSYSTHEHGRIGIMLGELIEHGYHASASQIQPAWNNDIVDNLWGQNSHLIINCQASKDDLT